MKTSKSRRRKTSKSRKPSSRGGKKERTNPKAKTINRKNHHKILEVRERIDWLSPAGKGLGTMDKLFAHMHGLFHAASHVYIVDSQNNVVLQKRGKWMLLQPGKWDTSAGGHVGADEKQVDAAIREANEEMNARGAIRFLGQMDIADKTPAYHNRERIFYYAMKSKTPIRYQKSEVEGIARVPFEKMDSFLKTHACTPWLSQSWKKYGARIMRVN